MRIFGVFSKCMVPVLVTVFLCSDAAAEKGSTRLGDWDVAFSLSGESRIQNFDADNMPAIRMPDYLRNQRNNFKMAQYYATLRTDKLTDNPLAHGATYADMILEARNAGLRLSCELITEHRGASYGTYAMRNIAIVPKYFVAMDTSFTVGGQLFRAGVEAGNFDDHLLYEGLTIYNIDVQGYRLYLKWKNVKLGVHHIGDMEYGIGLNINDQRDYMFSLEDMTVFDQMKIDARAGYFDYCKSEGYDLGLPGTGMNVSIGLQWKETVRLYSQVGIRRINDSSHGGIKRCASLAGCRVRGGLKMFDLDLTAEYRYYGRYFNQGLEYAGDCFLYRGYDGFGGCYSWNTVGNYLYPLGLFHRPFSQWAVYTDYQERDVQSFIFRADASCRLPGDCTAICKLDFNVIDASGEESYLYPFYDIGFGWAPVSGTSITLSHTNRAINLDTHYPTLYQLKSGLLMLTFQGALSF